MNALKLFFACLAVAVATDSTYYPSYCVTSKDTKEGQQKCKGDVFLKGKYIEVGIHNVGSFGTQYNAPSGFVSSGKKLGFIADYDKNGFSVGTPGYAGDYFVPGSPVEGTFRRFYVFDVVIRMAAPVDQFKRSKKPQSQRRSHERL